MKRKQKQFLGFTVILFAVIFTLAGCDNESGGNAPTLTDIKIVANTSQILSGPYLTQVTKEAQVFVVLFASDQDLDISKSLSLQLFPKKSL